MSEKEHEKSVNITPPPEYAEESVHLRNFKCNKCKERFITQQFLESHKRYKHVQQTDNNLTLVVENNIEDESKFECDQCSFSSKYLKNLNRHKEVIHKKRKPKDHISSAIKRSKVIKGFSCESCDYKCVTKFNLNRHVSRMH